MTRAAESLAMVPRMRGRGSTNTCNHVGLLLQKPLNNREGSQ
jgi:hypothetical protein